MSTPQQRLEEIAKQKKALADEEAQLLAEQDEEWLTAKIYLNMKP